MSSLATATECKHRIDRDGISLLEVLISIAVLSIGLLGVLALIPVASHQAQEGARKDTTAIAGRRIFREFFVRGYHAAESWDAPTPSGSTRPDLLVEGLPARAFCIDPFGYRLHYGASIPLTTADNLVYSFPSGDPLPSVFLPRHSLLRTDVVNQRLTASQVEEVFTFQDDLDFELPESSKEQSLQNALYVQSGGTKNAVKRYASGEFSWFATLVPKQNLSLQPEPSYKLSIAIVRDRTQFGETVIDLAGLPQTYGGTGEIELLQSSPDLRPGHWLMLMAAPGTHGDTGDTTTNAQYEWYRVVATDGVNVTISGADWTSTLQPIAVIVPRTVAVYSKTIPFVRYAQ